MSHDDDRTEGIARNVKANEALDDQFGIDSTNRFAKKDELRYKLEKLGLSSQLADDWEDDLNDRKVFLIAQNDQGMEKILA